MTNNDIVQKLWNLYDVLRDDGINYSDYVTELEDSNFKAHLLRISKVPQLEFLNLKV